MVNLLIDKSANVLKTIEERWKLKTLCRQTRTQEHCWKTGRKNITSSQEWSTSIFPCSLTRNITLHSMKNLDFHSSLKWKMIILPILTTSLIHFSLRGCENVLYELVSERLKLDRQDIPGRKNFKSRTTQRWSQKIYRYKIEEHSIALMIFPWSYGSSLGVIDCTEWCKLR